MDSADQHCFSMPCKACSEKFDAWSTRLSTRTMRSGPPHRESNGAGWWLGLQGTRCHLRLVKLAEWSKSRRQATCLRKITMFRHQNCA